MAVIKHDADLDFSGVGKIIRALMNPVASDPGSPAIGEFWYNTTSNRLKYYDGAVQTVANLNDVTGGAITGALWDAQSYIKAIVDDTPVVQVVGQSELVGRGTAGDLGVVSFAALLTALEAIGITADTIGTSSEANLLARANHTGTQLADTISDFAAAVILTAPDIEVVGSLPASTPTKHGDIYVDSTGGGIYVATGISSSADWTLVGHTSHTPFVASSGTGAPASTPTYIGEIYIDNNTDDVYVSTDTNGPADWVQPGNTTGLAAITSGTVDPSAVTPTQVGDIYVNTTNSTVFMAWGTGAGDYDEVTHSNVDAQTLNGLTDVQVLSRANHTGTQTAATISDFNTAADARAQAIVDALVDAAPGTLDTLNELAAAIGDDANFSTTITNSIATKTGKFAVDIGNAALQTFTVNHALGSTDVIVTVYDNTTKDVVVCEVSHTDANNVTIDTNSVPTLNQYRVVVIG